MANVAVQADGLKDFRRDLRKFDKEIGKEFQRDLRAISQRVAREAAMLAPRGATGALQAGYRGSAVGTKGVVRNRVFYSRFIEFGFHPRGGETFVEGRNIIGRAVERNEDRIVDELGDAVEKAATNAGWR